MKRPINSQHGFAHYVMPLVVVGLFAVIGALYLRLSHAATINCLSRPYSASVNAADASTDGHCVQYVQQMLNAAYENITNVNDGGRPQNLNGMALVGVTGTFTAPTSTALEDFQNYTNLPQTGTVNIATWNKLCAYALNGESAAQRTGAADSMSVMRAGYSAGASAGCTTATVPTKLVTLGGSIAAGYGLPVADPADLVILQNGTHNYPSKACRQSTESFAYIAAADKGLQLIQAACTGASSNDLLTDTHGGVGTQLQFTASDVKHNVVILGPFGANDVNWENEQSICLLHGCAALSATPGAKYYDPNANTATYNANLAKLAANIKTIVKTLENEGAQKVLVDEYYAVTQGGPSCIMQRASETGANHTFTSADYSFMTTRLQALNNTIATNAKAAGATIVTPNFNNHGVCESDPWVAVSGFNNGAAMHPTYDGQKYLAQLNESAM